MLFLALFVCEKYNEVLRGPPHTTESIKLNDISFYLFPYILYVYCKKKNFLSIIIFFFKFWFLNFDWKICSKAAFVWTEF